MKSKWNVKVLTEGGMMIALATILSYIAIYQAPMGGSVTAGSMIPIIIFSLRWGVFKGTLLGIVYGVIQFILKPSFYHPLQFILDYPLAFGFLGLGGLFSSKSSISLSKSYKNIFLATLVGIFGRLIAHVLSGVIFFAEYAGDLNPWIYSIQYNAYYLVPELVISVVIILLVWKPISKTLQFN